MTLIFLFQLVAAGIASANSCVSTTTHEQQLENMKYFALHGTCAPGAEVMYGTVASNLPCFKMKYLEGDDAGRVVPERCYPDKPKCESMLQPGESFNISDLKKQADVPDEDADSLKNRISKAVHLAIKIGQKGLQYSAISVPFGDGVNGFLGDMGEKMDEKADEKEKAQAAAKQLKTIFSYLLGTAPSTIPDVPTSCNDFKKAPFHDGIGVDRGLTDLFINLSQDKNIHMGTNDDLALSPGQIKFIKLLGKISKDTIPDPTPASANQLIPLERVAPFSFNQMPAKDIGPETGSDTTPTSSTVHTAQ